MRAPPQLDDVLLIDDLAAAKPLNAPAAVKVSDAIRLSSVAVNGPDATELTRFYADITGRRSHLSHREWATINGPGSRIDLQTIKNY